MRGAMWKTFVIFELLQVAVLTAENVDITGISTSALSPTTKVPTKNVQGKEVTASLSPPTSTKQIAASTTTTSPTTTKDIDECASSPCQHEGSCIDGVNKYTCSCVAGYTDNNCQTNIDECASSRCQNGGSCIDGVNKYTCSCVAGYTDNNCQTNIDECASSPCQNGGSCIDGVNKYTCSCVAGYTDNNCQTNIDECASSPCQHGGSCIDGVNKYTCSCVAGYTDNNCQTNINECASSPCQHEGSCIDGVNKYTCSCVAGYTDNNCQTNIDECTSNPCQHGGTCTDKVNEYTCSCVAGFTDNNCQTNIDDCELHPCQNGGTCTDGINRYNCSCTEEHAGRNCQIKLLPPGNILLQAVSTTVFTIHIVNASIQMFKITTNATKDIMYTNETNYKISGLTPGTCYRTDVCTFVPNKCSVGVRRNICLNPARPVGVTVSGDATTNSVPLSITRGDGFVSRFDILINNVLHSSVMPSKHMLTSTNLEDLLPGSLYTNVSVRSVTNGLNSSTTALKENIITVPVPPRSVEIINPTEKTFVRLKIIRGLGKSEYFRFYWNSTNSNKQVQNDFAANMNSCTYNLTDLLPGRTFVVHVTTVSHKKESAYYENEILVITKPDTPILQINDSATTENQISVTVSKKDGGFDSFHIGSEEGLSYKIHGPRFTINQLKPGQRYHFWATVTYKNHESDRTDTLTICTVPSPPNLSLVKKSSTTNSFVGNINKAVGGKERFEIYCYGEQRTKIITENSSLVRINNLEPGQIYNCTAKTIFCNHTSAASNVVNECTDEATKKISLEFKHNPKVFT